MVGYMTDWEFQKATDKSDVIGSFSRYYTLKEGGFYSLKFAGTDDEIDLMIHDSASRTSGTTYAYVYSGTTPGAGEYFKLGPMMRILEGVSAWGYGIGAVINRTSAGISFDLISLNSGSTSVTTDDTTAVALSDSTWYLIEMVMTESLPNCTATCKIFDEYLGTQQGSTITKTYADSATRGSEFGAFFQRNTSDCYIDNISLLW